MRTVTATRYVTPLREGGSMPAIVEADDLGTYVLKFRGAGQGQKALVAELIAGELGRALGLAVPEIVYMELDPILGRSEPDAEIRALIRASAGLNLALDYLPGSITFDPALPPPDGFAALAARVVWFDALVSNVDRTARNTNLLLWHKRLYLIDHGAALYFHHQSEPYSKLAQRRFPQVRDHVLLPFADDPLSVDEALAERLSPALIRGIVEMVPDAWLDADAAAAQSARADYVDYFLARLAAPRGFALEAADARSQLV